MSDVLQNKDPKPQQPDKHLGRLCQMTLVKSQMRYCFRYETGDERAMIQAIAELAADAGNDLTETDALVLSHQIARHIEEYQTEDTPPQISQ